MKMTHVIMVASISFALLAGCAAGAASTPVTNANQTEKQVTSTPAPDNTSTQIMGPFFTRGNQHPDKELIQHINDEKNTLDIAIYSLTHTGIVKAIIDAEKRGVKVRMITDHQEASNQIQAKLLKELIDAGIPIKQNNHKGLMHDKYIVFNHQVVSTGSFNYTNAASSINDENLMFIVNKKVADDYSKQFDTMFNDTTGFVDWR